MEQRAYQVMEPIYRGIVIIRQSFPNGCGGESLLFFAHTRGNDGSNVILLLYDTQSPIIGKVQQQVTPLVGLLNVFWHAVGRTVAFS